MTPDFWQLLLSAELPFVRRESLLRRASQKPANTDWRRFFDDAPELSPADRARLQKVRIEAVQEALGLGAVLLEKDNLPDKYKSLTGVPSALFVWGDVECFSTPSVAIVGTRGASTYGKAAARKFAEALAGSGVTIVSGGAQGIDAAAHEGAMAGGGKTACVLACGVDRVYPAVHRGLFDRIRGSGCLVSQFPAGWNPRGDSFVHRNATIAALSDAILVVEAPARSGALITSSRAAEYGRPIFVVPGNISMNSFRGSHELIREGATLVDDPDQVLEVMDIRPQLTLANSAPSNVTHQKILGSLGAEALPVDKIAEASQLDPAELLSELTLLELDGKIIRGPGGYILAP